MIMISYKCDVCGEIKKVNPISLTRYGPVANAPKKRWCKKCDREMHITGCARKGLSPKALEMLERGKIELVENITSKKEEEMEMIELLKLVTGDIAIGKKSPGEDRYTDVYRVIYKAVGNNKADIHLVPLLFPLGKGKTKVMRASYVVCSEEAKEEVQKIYIRVNSGLVLADKLPPAGPGKNLN